MVIYEFLCPQHGAFELLLPMGTAGSAVPCPQCGALAARELAAPTVLRSSRSPWRSAIERAEKSRHEPEIVGSVPRAGAPRRIRQAPLTPALQRLPRP